MLLEMSVSQRMTSNTIYVCIVAFSGGLKCLHKIKSLDPCDTYHMFGDQAGGDPCLLCIYTFFHLTIKCMCL